MVVIMPGAMAGIAEPGAAGMGFMMTFTMTMAAAAATMAAAMTGRMMAGRMGMLGIGLKKYRLIHIQI